MEKLWFDTTMECDVNCPERYDRNYDFRYYDITSGTIKSKNPCPKGKAFDLKTRTCKPVKDGKIQGFANYLSAHTGYYKPEDKTLYELDNSFMIKPF